MEKLMREFDEANPALPLVRLLHPKASIPTDAPGAIIDFRSSDETVDRYREVIAAAGWKLDNYKKNPVVQNAHRYGHVLDTVGKSIVTEVRGDHLYQRVQFAVDENPIAKITHGLYKGGFLSAVSVGFLPVKSEKGSQELGYNRRFTEQELLEVSAVGIPANPNALKLGYDQGAIEKSDLKELHQLLKSFCSDDAGIQTDSRAQGPDANGARLLQLLNATSSMLR